MFFRGLDMKIKRLTSIYGLMVQYWLLHITPFTPSVLGSYLGITKKNFSKYTISTEKAILGSVERKIQVKQWISYFLTILVVSYLLLSLIFRVLGTFHGIYW